MGFRKALVNFSLPLMALLYGACTANVNNSDIIQNNPPPKVERKLSYFPSEGYMKIDENTWFYNNSGIPYLPELDSLDGITDGKLSTQLTWRDDVAYKNGEFLALTSSRGDNKSSPLVVSIDRYGHAKTIFFDKDFSQDFTQISFDVQDYGMRDSNDEIVLVMRYGNRKSFLVIDPINQIPVFWYEAGDINLATRQGKKLIVGISDDNGKSFTENYEWDGSKYAKKDAPADSQVGNNEMRKVAFVAGICSDDPKGTFKEIADWIVQDIGYSENDLSYYNYSKNGASGSTYKPSETLNSIDGVDGSAENFKNFLAGLEEPDTKFDIIAHSLGGIIALYTLNKYPELQRHVNSVTTINSPVRGMDTAKSKISELFSCAPGNESTSNVLDDIKEGSPVITNINNTDYSLMLSEGIHVTTIANSNDIVVSSPKYKSGRAGTLNTASWHIYPFGLDPPIGMVVRFHAFINPISYAHSSPLEIESLRDFGKTEESDAMKDFLESSIGK